MIPSRIIGPSRRHLCPDPSARCAPLSSLPAAALFLGALTLSGGARGPGPLAAPARSVSWLLSGVAWLVSVSAAFSGSMVPRYPDKSDENPTTTNHCLCMGGA